MPYIDPMGLFQVDFFLCFSDFVACDLTNTTAFLGGICCGPA